MPAYKFRILVVGDDGQPQKKIETVESQTRKQAEIFVDTTFLWLALPVYLGEVVEDEPVNNGQLQLEF